MFGKKDRTPKFNPSPGLVRLSYRLLFEDPRMIAVLAVGSIASTVVLAAILVPSWTVLHITPSVTEGGLPGLLVYAAALWAASFVSTTSVGVVVAAAQVRCETGAPDLRRALALAWSRRGPIAAWAALATIVALLMQLLERTGVGGILVRLVAGIGWAVATVFAVPVLIADGTMPVETVRRSADVVRQRLGAVVRSNIRLALPWIVATLVLTFVAIIASVTFAFSLGSADVGVTAVSGAITFAAGIALFFCLATQAGLSAFLDTLLYRYAIGLPVPPIEPGDLPPAFPPPTPL